MVRGMMEDSQEDCCGACRGFVASFLGPGWASSR
jgi:hypothetical protein